MRLLRSTLLAAALALAPQLARAADTVRVAFNWNVPYSGWAGFYVARDKGYFTDEGLDVEFMLLKGSNSVNQTVGAGGADLGVSNASSVVVAASQGVPITAVSAYMQSNPEAVIARKDRGIATLADFSGKKVGTNVANPTNYLFQSKLTRAGVDVDKIDWVSVQPEAMVPLLLKGEIDAAMGYWDWEAINVEQAGVPANVFVMSDKSVQIYGPVVSANTAWMNQHGDVIKRFLKASVKGWIDAAADQKATLEVMMKANPDEDRAFMTKALAISMKLIASSAAAEHGFGWMEHKDWEALQDALVKGKVVETKVDAEKLFTNADLPDNAKDWKSSEPLPN